MYAAAYYNSVDILFCFLELSDEAEMSVSKALGRGPNDILSDAFRIRISRNDMATLGGLNWLNDEVHMLCTSLSRFNSHIKVNLF